MRTRMVGNVGFNEDIRPLFTEGDQQCMIRFGIDLFDWTSVKENMALIDERVNESTGQPIMPPSGWSEDKKELFQDWIEEGAPKRRGSVYLDYFSELDYHTEYHDVSGLSAEKNLMPQVFKYFRKPPTDLWMDFAEIKRSDTEEKNEAWDDVLDSIKDTSIVSAIEEVESFLRTIARKYFATESGFDVLALIDCYNEFGRDRLPADKDRLKRIQNLNDPTDFRLTYAEFHRMDSTIMWFYWAGHLELANHLLKGQDGIEITQSMLTGVCSGSAYDFLFRERGRTKDRYYAQGERAIWRQIKRSLKDFARMQRESHELYQEFREDRPIPQSDEIVRFSSNKVV